MRSRTSLVFRIAPLAALVGLAAAAPADAQQSRHSDSKNFCPDRLPVAQERIKDAYRSGRDDDASARSGVDATVRGPDGTEMSVSIESRVVGSSEPSDLGPDDVETGLADLVFNCGKQHHSDKECHVDVYLDGEEITSMGPTTHGRVALKCLPAGRHELRIDSVADTIYKGTIELDSDVEHMARIEETGFDSYDFEIYAENPIPDRIPQPSAVASEDDDDRDDAEPEGDHETEAEVDGPDEASASVDVEGGPGERAAERARVDVDIDAPGPSHGHGSEREADDDRDARDEDDDPERAPMDRSDFADLTRQVEDESFMKGRIRVVEMAARGNWFEADQVRELVGLMTHGKGRVEVATTLHERTVDTENYYKVLSAFDFEANKQKVRERLDL